MKKLYNVEIGRLFYFYEASEEHARQHIYLRSGEDHFSYECITNRHLVDGYVDITTKTLKVK